MPNFRIKDRIVCKDAGLNTGITVGEVYTVIEGDPGLDMFGVYITNDYGKSQYYYSHRFQLAFLTEEILISEYSIS